MVYVECVDGPLVNLQFRIIINILCHNITQYVDRRRSWGVAARASNIF